MKYLTCVGDCGTRVALSDEEYERLGVDLTEDELHNLTPREKSIVFDHVCDQCVDAEIARSEKEALKKGAKRWNSHSYIRGN